MITQRFISILDLVGEHRKLGKGPLHAHKMKDKTTLRNNNENPVSQIINCSGLRLLLLMGSTWYLGQPLMCWSNSPAPPTTNSSFIYTSQHSGFQYKWTVHGPRNRHARFPPKAYQNSFPIPSMAVNIAQNPDMPYSRFCCYLISKKHSTPLHSIQN